MGNYLFCSKCVCAAFKISKQRLSRQRRIKRASSQDPIVDMMKDRVENERLGDFVVMPTSVEFPFLTWWRSLDQEHTVQVRYPYQRHGCAGKPSHSSKQGVREDALAFVDANIQPNGRSADSFGRTHYFVSTFTTIQTPKKDVAHYSERLTHSVVGEFNRTQQQSGKHTCSNGSASNWFRQYRPKVAICPHKLDYCDTCAYFNKEIHAKQTTLNRLQHTSSTDDEELKCLKESVENLQSDLEAHKLIAQKSHKYYIEMVNRCATQWKRIAELQEKESLSDEKRKNFLGILAYS